MCKEDLVRPSTWTWRISLLAVVFVVISGTVTAQDNPVQDKIFTWAKTFSTQIYEALNQVTFTEGIKKKFSNFESKIDRVTFKVRKKSGESLLSEIKSDLESMLLSTIQSVRRVVDQAENFNHVYKEKTGLKFDYVNARKTKSVDDSEEKAENPSDVQPEVDEDQNVLHLKKVKRFKDIPVNLTQTTVHVPINVYDQADNVINAIKWSSDLDRIFKSSYENTPTLTWQYFCSTEGFMRQYPGIKWAGMEPDLYDCRVRNWYIQAAASPKDVVILLDLSGSMAGLRKEIAKHVVYSLLDTLSDNDFVSVMNFSATTDPLVPCFGDELVQANMENIRAFKTHLDTLETMKVANFKDSLIKAFNVLEKSSRSGRTSNCNKAIMIVTDGAPYTFEALFRKYNWNEQNSSVRVFTYLIGREVTERREVKWMACANLGYFSHVTTLSEVREQILKYIPVLARPLVMTDYHPLTWTNVYADITQPKPGFSTMQSLKLMTTASMPVLDKKDKLNRANLLGVVGIDVPIENIKQVTTPYKIGVNGYVFAVSNNGHILFHPDHRPLFDDILKPNYNSVDLTEVELVQGDSNSGPREVHDDLLKLRKYMIDRMESKSLQKIELPVHIHLDKMKRVVSRENVYYFTPLDRTPFTLGLALPKGYGHQEIIGKIDTTKKYSDFMAYLSGDWTLHPDWIYCQYRNRSEPYESVKEFLKSVLLREVHVDWQVPRVLPPITDAQLKEGSPHPDAHGLYCDRNLIESLLFDALIADIPNVDGKDSIKQQVEYNNKSQSIVKYGVTAIFIGTRSGFTKFKLYVDEYPTNENDTVQMDTIPDRTVDELYYKQAVDFYAHSPVAFVFTVPFDAHRRNMSDIRVTGSRALFLDSSDGRYPQAVPWGVFAVNMKYSVFSSIFLDGLTNCVNCKVNCSSDTYRCYLLDNNGLVVVSSDFSDTGKFFGEVDINLLNALLEERIYKAITIYDYQGVCLDVISTSSSANFLLSPLKFLKSVISVIWSSIITMFFETSIFDWIREAYAVDQAYYSSNVVPNKTRPRPCDKEIKLYEFQGINEDHITGKIKQPNSQDCDRTFVATLVPNTNLVLFVVNMDCPFYSATIKHEPTEVLNNGTDPICMQNQRNMYRRPPEWQCSSVFSNESVDQCGGSSTLQPSTLLFLLIAAGTSFVSTIHSNS